MPPPHRNGVPVSTPTGGLWTWHPTQVRIDERGNTHRTPESRHVYLVQWIIGFLRTPIRDSRGGTGAGCRTVVSSVSPTLESKQREKSRLTCPLLGDGMVGCKSLLTVEGLGRSVHSPRTVSRDGCRDQGPIKDGRGRFGTSVLITLDCDRSVV